LSIHHGYDIQDDNIWKTIIEKMKSCIYVWKSRNLTCGGKTLITKNLLLSLCENEIEMRGNMHNLVSNESIPASQGSYTPFISLSPLKEQAIGSICRM
jgi:hypothetical protein